MQNGSKSNHKQEVAQSHKKFDLGTAFPLFFSFLNQKDKVKFSETCKFLQQVTYRPQNWQTFTISQYEISQCWSPFLEWTQSKLPIIKPHTLTLNLPTPDLIQKLTKIFTPQNPWVRTLTIRTDSEYLHLVLISSCKNLTKLVVESNIASDGLCEVMCKNLVHLREVNIAYDSLEFRGRGLKKYIVGGLEGLVLKPYQLDFEEILEFVRDEEKNQLREVELDVEQCGETTLLEIMKSLAKVQVLRLYHMQQFKASKLMSDSLCENVQELTLTKAYDLQMKPLIKKIATPYLQTLDLTEAYLLKNDDVSYLADNCPNLVNFNVGWCNNVNCESVGKIVRKCSRLRKIGVTGVKEVNDGIFGEYCQFKEDFNQKQYDQVKRYFKDLYHKKQTQKIEQLQQNFTISRFFKSNPKKPQNTLANVRFIQTSKCNNISDAILKIIFCFNRLVKVYNYYSDDVGLYSLGFEDQDY